MTPHLKLETNGAPLWRVVLLIAASGLLIGFLLRGAVTEVLSRDLGIVGVRESIARIDRENKERDVLRAKNGNEFREALTEFRIQLERQNTVLELLSRQIEKMPTNK